MITFLLKSCGIVPVVTLAVVHRNHQHIRIGMLDWSRFMVSIGFELLNSVGSLGTRKRIGIEVSRVQGGQEQNPYDLALVVQSSPTVINSMPGMHTSDGSSFPATLQPGRRRRANNSR